MRTAVAPLRSAVIALVLGFSLSLPLAAQAQPSGFRGQGDSVGLQRERHPRQFQPQRPEEAGRRSWQYQRQEDVNGGNDRPGHLSPEERRQLRRDIRDAGQDVYRPGRFERHRQ